MRALAMVVALMAAGAARAQAPAPTPAPPPQQQQAPEREGGTLSGKVVNVQPEQGRLVIAGPRGNVEVNGAPRQLFGLEPGESASFSYGDYGGRLWVSSRAGVGGPVEIEGDQGEFGQLVGEVRQVDPPGGNLVVGDQRFRAHPEYLEEIEAGETIALSYRRFGGTAWVIDLQPREPSTGPGAPAPGGEGSGVQQQGKPPGPGFGTQGTGGQQPGFEGERSGEPSPSAPPR